MHGYRKVPCSVWRGGTSKGVMLNRNDLPRDESALSKALLMIMGSPDVRQLNGIGGATPTTSKIAILASSRRPDIDVDYTFAQVAIDTAEVDYGPNCGNVSAAVGPFSVESGLVGAISSGPMTVRIFNTNTERAIHSTFLVRSGQFVCDGDIFIPGVPGSASGVRLRFLRPDGGATGTLFPTGQLIDVISLPDGRSFEVSVVDAGNLSVIVDGSQFEDGWDRPWFEENADWGLGFTLETIRQKVGWMVNLYRPDERVTATTHALPKITVVRANHCYWTRTGELIDAGQMTITARAVTMGKPHPAYPVTGGTALAACAQIPGTVAHRLANELHHGYPYVVIGHPGGIWSVETEVSLAENQWQVDVVTSMRTARPLIDGWVFLPTELYD